MNTNYNLSNNQKISRTIYAANLDAKIFLERDLTINNNNYIQTLVPSVVYNFIPKKNQTSIPNFDSVRLSTSYNNLFNRNSFTGFDKVGNQNNLTFGIESEFINDDNGETLLNMRAGQKFYLDDEIMNSSGAFEKTVNSIRGYSNIETVIEADLNALNFNQSLSYNPDTSQVDKFTIGLKLLFLDANFANIQYIDENNVEHIQINGSYNLSDSNNIFWNFQRNLTSKITDRLLFGLTNENCCTAYRFAFFKKNNSNQSSSYDRSFEIVFKGLSSTTPSLRRRIEAEIPDYIGNLDNNL